MGVKQAYEIHAREMTIDYEKHVVTTTRAFKRDDGTWDNDPVDLTENLEIALDVKNLRVGYYSLLKNLGVHVWQEHSINETKEKPTVSEPRKQWIRETLGLPKDYKIRPFQGMRARVKLLVSPFTIVEIRAFDKPMWEMLDEFITLWQAAVAEDPAREKLVPVATIEKWRDVWVGKAPVLKLSDFMSRPSDLVDLPPPRPYTKYILDEPPTEPAPDFFPDDRWEPDYWPPSSDEPDYEDPFLKKTAKG
jgi:hypothetical protein